MHIQVVENTSSELVVRLVPLYAFWLFAFGFASVLAGPFSLWLLGRTTELEVHGGELQYRRSFLRLIELEGRTIPIQAIRSVDTPTYYSFGPTMDVTVHTEHESLRIRFVNLEGDSKRALAARLRTAVELPFDLTEHSGKKGPIFGGILGGMLLIAGLWSLSLLQTSTVVGSSAQQRLTVRIRRWLLPWTREKSIDLTDFESVDHRELSLRSDSDIEATSNFVFAQTKSGKRIKLAAGPMFTDDSAALIADLIEGWVKGTQWASRKRSKKRVNRRRR